MKPIIIAAAVLIWPLVGFTAGYGQELTQAEQQAMEDTLQYALEENQLNQGSEWVNPDTDRSGVVAPTRTFSNSQGQACREFIKTIIIGGKEEQGYGTACRQADGSWQIVSPQQQTARPPQSTTVYVHTPPERYYAYPPEVYFRSPIYLSFSYFHRHGRSYRGDFHISGRDYWYRHPHRIKQKVIVVPPRYERYRRHDGLKYKGTYRYRDGWDDHRGRGDHRSWDRDRGRDDHRSWDRDRDRGRDRGWRHDGRR
jgi:surface antigen